MMLEMHVQILPIIVVFATLIFSVSIISIQRNLRLRSHELSNIQEALAQFYSASERIMEDPSVPEGIREGVAILSVTMCDREISHRFLCLVARGEVRGRSGRGSGTIKDKDFEHLNQKQFDDVFTSLSCAMYVIGYRWPENARISRSMAAIGPITQKERIRYFDATFGVRDLVVPPGVAGAVAA